MENKWAKALEEGKEVTVDINPVYEAGSKRPTKFVARYTIDGQQCQRIFRNKSGG